MWPFQVRIAWTRMYSQASTPSVLSSPELRIPPRMLTPSPPTSRPFHVCQSLVPRTSSTPTNCSPGSNMACIWLCARVATGISPLVTSPARSP